MTVSKAAPASSGRNIYTADNEKKLEKVKNHIKAFQTQKPKQRIVLKIGSGSIVESPDQNNGSVRIALNTLSLLVQTISSLISEGHQVCLISSGAVAVGCLKLGYSSPSDPAAPSKRALSAIGQSHLIQIYEQLFSLFGQHTAQILLSYGEFGDQSRYMNAASTIEDLFAKGIVPIINENDATSVKDKSLGDNDRLGALVSCLVNADWLFLLTDVDGVFTSNPKTNPETSKLISVVKDVRKLEQDIKITANGMSWGTGGMATKIYASSLASGAGIRSVIMRASRVDKVPGMISGKDLCGTYVRPSALPLSMNPSGGSKTNRKKWIANASRLASPIYKEASTSSTIKVVDNSTPVVIVNEKALEEIQRDECLKIEGIQEIYGNFKSDTIINIFCPKRDAQKTSEDGFSSSSSGSDEDTEGKIPPLTGPIEYIEVASGITHFSSEELQSMKTLAEEQQMNQLDSSSEETNSEGKPCVVEHSDFVFWSDRLAVQAE